ncbi:hypothetical protein EVAR_87392_1 [Eumeta japonica]|uniref:Uncharacterized protein n=1 Tax=Eumeta variegata TaxID=151549 RepID=A0A4C1Y2S5_EUMVA|nr:hypothetical protein EVAR_87392_1 [Eumeta japonica]
MNMRCWARILLRNSATCARNTDSRPYHSNGGRNGRMKRGCRVLAGCVPPELSLTGRTPTTETVISRFYDEIYVLKPN